MNERKICFIVCVNNDSYEQEMLKYLNNLIVPEGYELEYLSVRDAKSMTSGYNEGMEASDAKYKVYLHQDVFIVNPWFIQDMLDVFADPQVGMIGMVGAPELPENAIMWNGPRVGKLYFNMVYRAQKSEFGEVQGRYQEVEAVDGLLMATQYDLPWREDLFLNWDFYDASQSQEFLKRGYKVVVPRQKLPWCIHDDGFPNLKNYYEARKIFKQEYKKEEIELAERKCDAQVKATVVVTAYNQKGMLFRCLEWLEKVKGIGNIIVVDNGSEDGTAERLKDLNYDYIFFDEGIQGYGTVWNAVLENFETDDTIVFMEPRYFPEEECILQLEETLKKSKCGIAGPMSNGFFYIQHIQIDDLSKMTREECLGKPEKKSLNIEKGIWALSKEAWMENGAFLPDLKEPKNVLLDYELRLVQKGYQPMICRQAMAYDMLCGTGQTDFKTIFGEGDRTVLKDKWDMNYFNLIPSLFLADLIVEEEEAPIRVLEVGCDLGVTLLEIKDRYPNSQIYGLEINEASADIAKHLAEVKVGNIEDKSIPFDGKFDYIIFGDVLEHLRDPQGVVRFCKEKLSEHGCILTSIPNLMHVSVMEQLLHGRFQYTDTGLLDRSHIHFFTYYEILLMFQAEGYKMEEIKTTSVVITKEQEELAQKLLELSDGVDMHMYHTYQYLVKARKNG